MFSDLRLRTTGDIIKYKVSTEKHRSMEDRSNNNIFEEYNPKQTSIIWYYSIVERKIENKEKLFT